jgi:GTP-binding protein
LAKGGKGGLGNTRFKSSTNQAPRRTTPGGDSVEKYIWLRLKLIADVGLVGMPNAGKSSLLAAVSRARPKIANYPFTTLTPQLGAIATDDRMIILADIPGLVAGAHQGIGLGTRFLGHIERCQRLIHLVDVEQESVVKAYRMVRKELTAYSPELANKPELVVLSRIDTVDPATVKLQQAKLKRATQQPVHLLSSMTGQGLQELMNLVIQDLKKDL